MSRTVKEELQPKAIILGKKKLNKVLGRWESLFVKPSGTFWKRYFNKQVRQGKEYKKTNWFEWS